MHTQLDIEFDQLVKLVKKLPNKQWNKLKKEVENTLSEKNNNLESFLLAAPNFTKKQLNEICKTRKAINQWRKK